MGDLVEVCYDDRVCVWKVDLYEWDGETGMHLHRGQEGQYGGRPEAEAAAEDLAAAEGALLRVEDEGGSVQEESRP